jgi:hypothetical protein
MPPKSKSPDPFGTNLPGEYSIGVFGQEKAAYKMPVRIIKECL